MARDAQRAQLGTGVTLSYVTAGDRGGPVVVLHPGALDSWRSYDEVIDPIASAAFVVALSPRGHGDSDQPDTGYRIPDLARDLIDLLDHLDLGEAVLVGHSSSGLVAREAARSAPDRVSGLVLESSPTTLKADPGLTAFAERVLTDLTDPIDPDLIRSFVADTSSEGLDETYVDLLVQEISKVPARVWRAMFDDIARHDDTAALERVTAPTLLVWGDADALVGRTMQEELVARLPRARLAVYEGCGHTPRWEQPDRFARDVVAFVEQAG